MQKISINSRLKTYDIQNQDGEVIGQFTFNPFDNGIISRHEKVVAELEKNTKKDLKGLDGFIELEDSIKEQIDYLFNASVSETFFNIMSPLSMMPGGKTFAEEVIAELMNIVKKERIEADLLSKKKMDSYLKDYE